MKRTLSRSQLSRKELVAAIVGQARGRFFLTVAGRPGQQKESLELFDQGRQDTPYADFIAELHRRLAAVGGTARFEAGMHPVLYGIGLIVMAALAVMLAILLGRTALNRDMGGFALMVAVSALFAWQVGSLFYRNRPQIYRPDALPPRVLPGG